MIAVTAPTMSRETSSREKATGKRVDAISLRLGARSHDVYSHGMQRVLEYLELILTAAGVAVVVVFFYFFRNIAPWKAAALSALAVGVLHGIIFFIVRSAQRRVRQHAVATIRRTFDDLVRNKLQVVLFATEIQDQDWRPAAQRAVQEIQNNLSRIEAEALTAK